MILRDEENEESSVFLGSIPQRTVTEGMWFQVSGVINVYMEEEAKLTANKAVQSHRKVGSSRFVPNTLGESAEYLGR